MAHQNQSKMAQYQFRPKYSSPIDCCCVCCCPPLPTHIAAKLSLCPPKPTYAIGDPKISCGEDPTLFSRYLLTNPEGFNPPFSAETEPDRIDAFTTRSSRGNDLACIYVRAFPRSEFYPKAKFTILYSHANACDIGQMQRLFLVLSREIICNIFGY